MASKIKLKAFINTSFQIIQKLWIYLLVLMKQIHFIEPKKPYNFSLQI